MRLEADERRFGNHPAPECIEVHSDNGNTYMALDAHPRTTPGAETLQRRSKIHNPKGCGTPS